MIFQRSCLLRKSRSLVFLRSSFRFLRFNSSLSKTITKISFNDLPHVGETKHKTCLPTPEGSSSMQLLDSLPQMMRTIREIMDKYPDYAVLTEVGSFYELYFEGPARFAGALGITETKKSYKAMDIPMAGFPKNSIDRHLKVLLKDLNQGVVIVEQYVDDLNQMQRRVAQVISPGTLVDEAFLNQNIYNFLLSIDFPENTFKRAPNPDSPVGLAWVDISVGALFVQEVTLSELASAITRINPVEILLDQEIAGLNLGDWYQELMELQNHQNIKFRNLSKQHRTMDSFYDMFDTENSVDKLNTTFRSLATKETSSLRTLLRYIEEHFPESPINLQLPQRKFSENILQIDSRTADALELHKTSRDRFVRGSLLSSVRRTVTHSGGRLLSQWIAAPSTNLQEIEERQNIVTLFYKNSRFRKLVISHVKECRDIGRITQRFSMGRGSLIDLVHLATTLSKFDELKQFIIQEEKNSSIEGSRLSKLIRLPESQTELVREILNDIDIEALDNDTKLRNSQLHDDINPSIISNSTESSIEEDQRYEEIREHVVRESASEALQELHNNLRKLTKRTEKLQQSLEESLKDGLFKEVALKISTKNTHEVYIRGTKNSNFDILADVLKGSSISQKHRFTRWMHYPPWSSIGRDLELIKMKIQKEEANVVKALQKKVILKGLEIREIGHFLDYIDVTSSFAVLAKEKKLSRPVINNSTELSIINGRHLVVEDGLQKDMKHFVSNDLIMDDSKKLWVITGPNMGGKSTFLRQNAIIIILAQMGCYVPADRATIGVVDKLYSRVNSSDDLYNNLSTFMVEMTETSYILNGATPRSLAVLDEIGRGTTPREGVAVAFATLDHLSVVNKCRVLFSTHYGKEIEQLMTGKLGGHVFKKIKVLNDGNDDDLQITHKLIDGVADKAYAVHVATRAGFPLRALETSKRILNSLLV